MNCRLNILFSIVFSAFTFTILAQNYCPEKRLLLEKYKAGDYIQSKAYIDTVLLRCPDQKDNAYFWHISAFINFNIFQKIDNKSPISKARKEAVSAVLKSIELDKDDQYLEHNHQVTNVLANGFYNHYVGFLDTINYEKAVEFYQEFRALKLIVNPDEDLSQYEIQFHHMLAQIYKQLYHNDEKAIKFINLAIGSYENVLAIDPDNYSANKNLGILYHNLGVEIILKQLPIDADLEEIILMEEKAINNFKKSLPFLKKVYNSDPTDKAIVHGIAAVYFSLNDTKEHVKYYNLYRELQNTNSNNE